jgi:hypothetical protein
MTIKAPFIFHPSRGEVRTNRLVLTTTAQPCRITLSNTHPWLKGDYMRFDLSLGLTID